MSELNNAPVVLDIRGLTKKFPLEEITIMKYIGATDYFVRAPFVIECILIGLIGSAIPNSRAGLHGLALFVFTFPVYPCHPGVRPWPWPRCSFFF